MLPLQCRLWCFWWAFALAHPQQHSCQWRKGSCSLNLLGFGLFVLFSFNTCPLQNGEIYWKESEAFSYRNIYIKMGRKKKKNSGESQWAGRNFALWYSFHTKSIHILCFLLKQLPLANFHLVWLIHKVLQVLQLCLIPRQEEQGVGERFATRDGQVRLDGKSFVSSLSIFPERLSQSSVI